ncbi:MAG: TlpA family protein disulfide reductase [Alphaproteobacteria bacterium]|nr:TlpA family protein disulfide reductase [Alphaproteobacteria bacterium]
MENSPINPSIDNAKAVRVKRLMKWMVAFFLIAMATGFYWKSGLLGQSISPEKLAGLIPPQSAADQAQISQGQSFPDISFYNPQGDKVSVSDFRGKYVLINLWATWCGPCVVELPSLDSLQVKLKGKNIKILAVSMDRNMDQKTLRDFLAARGISDFALYHDQNRDIQAKISVPGIPVTYLIDPKGKIAFIFEGMATWDDQETLDFFAERLT